MNAEQLAEATANTREERDCNVRQVTNGYILNGNRRFLELDTPSVRVAITTEAVATSVTGAADAQSRFLKTGSFADTVEAA